VFPTGGPLVKVTPEAFFDRKMEHKACNLHMLGRKFKEEEVHELDVPEDAC
jgi:hypothetical protein